MLLNRIGQNLAVTLPVSIINDREELVAGRQLAVGGQAQ